MKQLYRFIVINRAIPTLFYDCFNSYQLKYGINKFILLKEKPKWFLYSV
jgi:hypothetical protein